MTDTDPARVVEAAQRARAVFPGPIGETIAEYLCAWADFGHRFGAHSRIAQVVGAVFEAEPAGTADR